MLRRFIDDSRFHVPLVLAFSLLLYFPFLGARDFWNHENDYAEVTRVMLLEGDFWSPQVNGKPWTHNPPLFFTLSAMFSWLLGGVSEWSIRLVPAIAAAIFVFSSYRFLARHFETRFAFLATFVTLSSLLTIHVERHLPINMVFFLFVVLSMFLLAEVLVFDSTRVIHSYGFWTFMGLACLVKGLVGIFFPILVSILYLSFSWSWKKVLAIRPVTGALLFFAIVNAWFIFAPTKAAEMGASVLESHQHLVDAQQLIYDYLLQFPKSVLYSVGNFPLDFLPWTFFLVPAVIYFWRERGKLRERAGLFFSLWVLAAAFLPQYFVEDHSHYVFLLVFPSAIVVGEFLNRLLDAPDGDRSKHYTRRSVIAFCMLLWVAALAFPVAAHLTWPELFWRDALLGAAFITAAWLLYFLLRLNNYPGVVLGFGLLMIAVNAIIQALVLPPVNSLQVRPFAEKLGTIIKADGAVAIFDSPHSHDLNYYSGIKKFKEVSRSDELAGFKAGSGPKYVLARGRKVAELKKRWRGKLNAVMTQQSGNEIWFAQGRQWVLLVGCEQGCDGNADGANPPIQTSDPLRHSHPIK